MEQIAFFIGDRILYWSSVILTLAAACSVFLFLGLYLRDRKDRFIPSACLLPLAAVLSLVGARLVHWYCLPDNYASLSDALTHFDRGGYALVGAIGGCLLAACLLRVLTIVKDLPDTLDCMAIGGAAGIAAGRLASAFNASDRGMILSDQIPFPWVCPVINTVTGQPEYRLATFAIQAILAGSITLILLAFYWKEQGKKSYHSGDTALLFGMLYGASEVVTDSTRYDSLYFRSNGFVSIVQVTGAVALVAAIVVFSLRLARRRDFRKTPQLAVWTGLPALIGVAGFMEYYVQRHASYAAMCYGVMSLCLCGVIAATMYIRYLAQREMAF